MAFHGIAQARAHAHVLSGQPRHTHALTHTGQLISALHRDRLPGATFNKDKEGQARRVLAAAQNM
eukprot:1139136-Pelagomonas_calceolata.AAC.3